MLNKLAQVIEKTLLCKLLQNIVLNLNFAETFVVRKRLINISIC